MAALPKYERVFLMPLRAATTVGSEGRAATRAARAIAVSLPVGCYLSLGCDTSVKLLIRFPDTATLQVRGGSSCAAAQHFRPHDLHV
jgi:hypothetical protein